MRGRMLGVVVLVIAAMPLASATAKCPATGARPAPFVSEAPPAAGLAARLGVLRRDQTADDRATIEAFKHQGLRILYARSLRLLASDPDGRSWYLYAGKTSPIRFERSCLHRMPAHLRRAMLQTERRSIVRARKVQFGVFEFAGGAGGGFFGGDLGSLKHNRATLSVRRPGGGASLSALVPDGVAWVNLTLGDGEKRVVGVSDNFWQLDTGGDGFRPPKRTVWKAADGTVVATFRGH